MPADVEARFEALQQKLVPLWHSIEALNEDEQTIVVVPSISIDMLEGTSIRMQPYEERYLFLLLLLRQPRARLIYVTSQPILPSVDRLLPRPAARRDPEPRAAAAVHGARARRHVAPADAEAARAPSAARAHPRAHPRPRPRHLVPYNTTELERDLAVRLGIPMYGADPRYFDLGTKTGCRRLFDEEGVRHPLGTEDLWSLDDVVDAIADLRAKKPAIAQVLVKLNEGVSGEGNALVDLAGLPDPGDADERAAIARVLEAMTFELADATLATYVAKLAERGGVVEERIPGDDLTSPSVQLRITPLGVVELLSTHDQLLGGPEGQTYLGCVFPANPAYATTISRDAAKIGARLAKEGVIGRLAVDFVATRNEDDEWETYAIEINLRKGGTTHPFLTLQFLTDGTYDTEAATFTAPSGKHKAFVASDAVKSSVYRGLTPDDLFDIVVRHRLHFDQSRQSGVVFHMLASLTEDGHFGMTAVGDDPAEAREIYDRAITVLDAEAHDALAERPLPPA